MVEYVRKYTRAAMIFKPSVETKPILSWAILSSNPYRSSVNVNSVLCNKHECSKIVNTNDWMTQINSASVCHTFEANGAMVQNMQKETNTKIPTYFHSSQTIVSAFAWEQFELWTLCCLLNKCKSQTKSAYTICVLNLY